MKYGVYVIEDGGTGTRSMPFYAESDLVAKRQFSATLRTLPPSVRGDFRVDRIASYDDYSLMFDYDDARESVGSICTGSDDDISKMIEMDAPFYQRGNIDRAPVSVSGGDDHE